MFKIYVGNLDYKVKVEQLRELFAVLGPIEDLVIPTDPKTNKPKGFAIVMIRDPEIGHAAIKAMQGKRLMGRALVVNEAIKKKKSATLPTKEQVIRNGPFGPRMNRFGDPRATGSRPSRNPRRSGPPMSRGSQAGFPNGPQSSLPTGAQPRPDPRPDPRSDLGPQAGSSANAPTGNPAAAGRPAMTPPPTPAAPARPAAPAQAIQPPAPRPVDTGGSARSTATTKVPPPSAPVSGDPPLPARPKAQRLSAPRTTGTDPDTKASS